MDWIRVIESELPQFLAPIVCELLRLCFPGKFAVHSFCMVINDLQMSELVQEHVVKDKSSHC